MSAIDMPLQAPTPGNSLGRAKGPCHNCAELHLDCDGQRPKCYQCMQNQISCRGYRLQLSWQSGVAARGNLRGFKYPASQPTLQTSQGSPPEETGTRRKKPENAGFKFVTGRPTKRRKVREHAGQSRFNSRASPPVPSPLPSPDSSPSNITSSRAAEMVKSPYDTVSYRDTINMDCEDFGSMDLDLSPDTDYSLPNSASIFTPTAFLDGNSPHCFAMGVYGQHSHISESFLSPAVGEDETATEDHHFFAPALQSPILFESLADKFHGVLAQYDQDICVIPLTSDCGLNPFRVRKESSSGSQFLLHAILATSFYHLTRNSGEAPSTDLMERHRSTSFHLFSKALGDSSMRSQGVAFLDTALLLMYLDSAQSANGMFDVHLEGIRSVIDMAGGANFLIPKMPKLRAQLAMFIWCDSTIALISRETPILPVTYLEAIIRHGRDDGWDYFKLAGCREEFVVAMIKLAKLAMQNEKAEEMEWLIFDTTGVDQVEEVLQEWPSIPPVYDGTEEEEALEEAQDRYHCVEAWKTALLLYIARVFRWKRSGPVPGTVRYLSRVILDHARSIRRSSTIQKQLLLPVFLAAAEMQNEDCREFARDYCQWWTKSCGFKMFTDVSSYLEDIWMAQDNPGIWWATIIDRRRKDSQQLRLPQILMG